MKKIAVFIFASLLVTACGDLAPDGTVVSGPADSTVKTDRLTGLSTRIYRDLDFIVRDGIGEDAHLLADIQVELYTGGTAVFTDINGTALSTPSIIVSRTDERGIVSVNVVVSNPGCTDTTDTAADGSVRATVGTASYVWTTTWTNSCAAPTP